MNGVRFILFMCLIFIVGCRDEPILPQPVSSPNRLSFEVPGHSRAVQVYEDDWLYFSTQGEWTGILVFEESFDSLQWHLFNEDDLVIFSRRDKNIQYTNRCYDSVGALVPNAYYRWSMISMSQGNCYYEFGKYPDVNKPSDPNET